MINEDTASSKSSLQPVIKTFHITVKHPFLSDLSSRDHTLLIDDCNDEESPFLDLRFRLEADPTAAAVFEFEFDEDSKKHKLKGRPGSNGLVISNRQKALAVSEFPSASAAILVCEKGKDPDWFPSSKGKYLLICSNGSLDWQALEECGCNI